MCSKVTQGDFFPHMSSYRKELFVQVTQGDFSPICSLPRGTLHVQLQEGALCPGYPGGLFPHLFVTQGDFSPICSLPRGTFPPFVRYPGGLSPHLFVTQEVTQGDFFQYISTQQRTQQSTQ
jgi:hypothetical protein